MADNVPITAGTGTSIATDDVSSVHYQRIKLDAGDNGATSPVVDIAVPTVLLPTGIKVVRLTATPTITAGAYGANDAVGGLLTFANAARLSGGSIVIEGITIVDEASQAASLELVLFDQTFTNTADNSPFDPTDADLANVIGVIPVSTYYTFNDNSVASRSGLGLACKLAGTSLFGQLVTRTAPTYAATDDVTVILHVIQN
jgi:hypothetical protein